MVAWAEEHKNNLLERIRHARDLLQRLQQQLETLDLDDLNREHREQLVQRLEHDIEWNEETVRIIDQWENS